MNDNVELKIVILKNPYETYRDSEFTREFLSKIFKLKLDGYTKHYPYGILPISEYDFICDHILICRKNNDGELEPISGFKSIHSSRCQKFQLPFPIINHKFGVKAHLFSEYVMSIQKWIDDQYYSGVEFAYNASWTMKPDLSKELRSIVRELTYSLVCLYYQSEGINLMINSTAALHGVNINEEKMGLHYLKDKHGDKMSPFPAPAFFDQPFYIMHTDLSGFNKDFLSQSMNKFGDLWNSRLIIDSVEAELKVA